MSKSGIYKRANEYCIEIHGKLSSSLYVSYHSGDLLQFGQLKPAVRSERIFLFAGRRDLRDAFLVMEHVIAEYRRVATGSAQQLRDVHHVLFVRRHYLWRKYIFIRHERLVGDPL